MSTTYLGKEAALTCIKALAAVGVVFPMAWLPVEWSSAAFLGLIGGSLQVMVPYVRDTEKKRTRIQNASIVFTGLLIAVFCNGIDIPLVKYFVPADAYWRVNTVLLAFIGISVPLFFLDVFKNYHGAGKAP